MYKLFSENFFVTLLIGITVLFAFSFSITEAANIDAVNKYAQFLDIDLDGDLTNDRINFLPVNPPGPGVDCSEIGVTVSASGTTGCIWGETVGWINTSPREGEVDLTCSNGVGTLSGHWWGENTGWITLDFDNNSAELTINEDGEFEGHAWSQNYGWIEFSCPGSDTCVETTYTCPSTGPGGGPGPGSTPATCSLEASPSTINAGDSVTLSWTTNIPGTGNYTTAAISSVGAVDGDNSPIVVYPNSTTTYTGSFAGNFRDGTAQCSDTVTITTPENQPISGCTDPLATNYDPYADVENYSCLYPEDIEQGCTDAEALNYDPTADVDDGSCDYPQDDDNDNDNDNDGDGDDGNGNGGDSDDPSAYIEDDNYVTSEDDDSVAITVLRSGPIDEPFDAILRIVDGSAFQGSDYDGVLEYHIHWDANDDQPRVIVMDIIDDADIEGRENFTAMLSSLSGGALDDALVAIRDNDFPLHRVATIAGLAALISGLASLPFRIQNILLAIPAYRRRHRKWGTVFDSHTGEPLDPAYVQLFDAEGNEKGSAITDLDGRYGFLVEPGTYYISSGKTDYEFPSKRLAGKEKTNLYDDLYFGETLEITEKGQVLTKNIPMDPHGVENWNEKAKRSMKVNQFFNRHDGVAHRIIDVMFMVGLLITVYAVVVAPVWYNIAIAALYAVMIVINILGLTSRAYGRIRDAAGRVIKGTVVRAFNAHLDKEVAHRVVGESGYYYMLVQKGDYYVTVEVPDGQGGHKHIHTSPNFTARDGVIRKNIRHD